MKHQHILAVFSILSMILLISSCTSNPHQGGNIGNGLVNSGGGKLGQEPRVEKRNPKGEQTGQALVIGNGFYQHSPLQNPVNDAKAITKKLVEMGFSVTQATNLNSQAMQRVVQDFQDSLSARDIALFYFSGHGAQIEGQNFLLPVDNEGIRENNLKVAAISAQTVLNNMKKVNQGMNFLVLDACRNNPYQGSEKSAYRGLAQMTPPRGAVIAFAAAPGQPALDDSDEGINGLYTSQLLKALENAAHKRIEDVLMAVREPVFDKSGGKQEPWYQASLREPFCFGGCQKQ